MASSALLQSPTPSCKRLTISFPSLHVVKRAWLCAPVLPLSVLLCGQVSMCVILGRLVASCRRAPRPASHGQRYDDGALESVLSPFHDAPAQEGVELRDLTAASVHPSSSTAGETEESEEQPLVVHSPGQTPSPDAGHAVQAAAGDGVLAVGDWAQAQVQVSHRPGFTHLPVSALRVTPLLPAAINPVAFSHA